MRVRECMLKGFEDFVGFNCFEGYLTLNSVNCDQIVCDRMNLGM